MRGAKIVKLFSLYSIAYKEYDASFKKEVEGNVLPETKAAQIEHANKREILVRIEEDEVFYTLLKQKAEGLLERFKERQMNIYELLEKLYLAQDDISNKVEGQTKSGLKPEEEPYFNKLVEVFEGQKEIDALKEIAVEVHQFIEGWVTSTPDWTRKNDFKRTLNAEIRVLEQERKMYKLKLNK
ncbi:type I restriction enzyme endonuclease domain-containing protein [Peribacillus loiseleuriae]|uniref:type I restriction enzyme endonuclease domain-containing protein n=1 Tax=Peribacillus loiseleuriae TaxID=1679170 RepID=UPI003CFDFFB6